MEPNSSKKSAFLLFDWSLTIKDYFKIHDRNEILNTLIMPAVSGIIIIVSHFLKFDVTNDLWDFFLNNVVSLMSILIGFSIATITILVTTENASLKLLKEEKINIKIDGWDYSLFDKILTSFLYTVILEIITIILVFIYPLFIDVEKNPIYYLVPFLLTMHVLSVLLRNMLNFYHSIFNRKVATNRKDRYTG